MAERIRETGKAGLDFDAIVIGTGFAGAVTACRLTEKGMKICVLERGRRFGKGDFPVFPPFDVPSAGSEERQGVAEERLAPDFSRLFWTSGQGLWDLRDLGDVVVAQAAGYGGGSLFYANVHLRPPADVFDEWPDQYRGKKLWDYFDLAAYMLDVKPFPSDIPLAKTEQMKKAAESLGREPQRFHPPLAINFEHPEEEGENGAKGMMRRNRYGRMQGICKLKGDCCFGCGMLAKNTLDLNYLALAEDAKKDGEPLADIRTLAEVAFLELIDESYYKVEYRDLLSGAPDELVSVTAEYVFLCAGSVNSTELLLRSRLAGKLKCRGDHLGEHFYPNADAFGVAFDCDDLHEANRGPTITSALLYEDCEHWLLFQDGGMPTELEPLLGLFRSPLWLGRNRFWEKNEVPPPSSRHPRMGYATLPFRSWTDALASLTPSALQWRRPLHHEVARAAAGLSRGLGRPSAADGSGQWSLLPKQLWDALPVHRRQLVDEILADVDPFLSDFMDETAHSVLSDLKEYGGNLLKVLEASDRKSRRGSTMEWLRKKLGIPEGMAEMAGTDEVKLAEDVMRLVVQLIWGSQSDLVRAVAEALLERVVPGNEKAAEQVSHLLQWALDFRLSHGRTGLVLCMGRDSEGGTLSLVAPEAPPVGSSTVMGADSGATGILVSLAPRNDGWARQEASGTIVVAKLSGKYKAGEILLVDDRPIGRSGSKPILTTPPDPVAPASAVHGTLKRALGSFELVAIDFEPLDLDARQKVLLQRRLLRLPLHARLPGPLEVRERITQEQMLRDIVHIGWRGELRTDPFWAFLRRRVTVHAQGGCSMGPVTDWEGWVKDCPGLYVMDAAAFPRSVGVNPSATIIAVAEFKVENFIRKHRGPEDWHTREFRCAKKWASSRRGEIDPIGRLARWSKPPTSQPIGIKFEEAMVGLCWEPGADQDDPRYSIRTALCASIRDLSCFLEQHSIGRAAEIALEGYVLIQGVGIPPLLRVRPGESHLRLTRAPGAQGPAKTHHLEYHLELDWARQRYVLEGEKTIRDDDRFDVWKDATTVKFKLKRNGKTLLEGALRVPASKFFGEQIPSFRATNTKDPVRQSWALAAFAKVFFGHLLDVYVPELDRAGDMAKSIVGRMHV